MNASSERIAWVDYAKGICIIAVVAMYSTYYIEDGLQARGWMHYFIDFAQPFRMPDFFLISGLFVHRVISRQWRYYLDSKIVHFLYFYALWVTVRFAILDGARLFRDAPGHALNDYFGLYLQPHGPLWFIYILPLFFLAVRLLQPLPWWLILGGAVILKLADLQTGWKMIDRFGIYFVFFYAGHLFAGRVFGWAEWVTAHRHAALASLLPWFILNLVLVRLGVTFLPAMHLLTGFAGAAAIIVVGVLLTGRREFDWLRYLGQHSLVVYLAFVVPLAIVRRTLLLLPSGTGAGMVAFAAAALSIAGAIAIYWSLRATPLRFLFERPAWAFLGDHRNWKMNTG